MVVESARMAEVQASAARAQTRIERDEADIANLRRRQIEEKVDFSDAISALEQRLSKIRRQRTDIISGGRSVETALALAKFNEVRAAREAAVIESAEVSVAEAGSPTQFRTPILVPEKIPLTQAERLERFEFEKEEFAVQRGELAGEVLRAKQAGARFEQIAPFAEPRLVSREPQQPSLTQLIQAGTIIPPSAFVTVRPEESKFVKALGIKEESARIGAGIAGRKAEFEFASGRPIRGTFARLEQFGEKLEVEEARFGRGIVEKPGEAALAFAAGAGFAGVGKVIPLLGKAAPAAKAAFEVGGKALGAVFAGSVAAELVTRPPSGRSEVVGRASRDVLAFTLGSGLVRGVELGLKRGKEAFEAFGFKRRARLLVEDVAVDVGPGRIITPKLIEVTRAKVKTALGPRAEVEFLGAPIEQVRGIRLTDIGEASGFVPGKKATVATGTIIELGEPTVVKPEDVGNVIALQLKGSRLDLARFTQKGRVETVVIGQPIDTVVSPSAFSQLQDRGAFFLEKGALGKTLKARSDIGRVILGEEKVGLESIFELSSKLEARQFTEIEGFIDVRGKATALQSAVFKVEPLSFEEGPIKTLFKRGPRGEPEGDIFSSKGGATLKAVFEEAVPSSKPAVVSAGIQIRKGGLVAEKVSGGELRLGRAAVSALEGPKARPRQTFFEESVSRGRALPKADSRVAFGVLGRSQVDLALGIQSGLVQASGLRIATAPKVEARFKSIEKVLTGQEVTPISREIARAKPRTVVDPITRALTGSGVVSAPAFDVPQVPVTDVIPGFPPIPGRKKKKDPFRVALEEEFDTAFFEREFKIPGLKKLLG